MDLILNDSFLRKIVFSLGVLIGIFVVSFFIKRAIDITFGRVKRRLTSDSTIAKTRTLRHLLKNIVDFGVFITGILLILSNWDIDIMPILTGAGILGLAVSFGSQTLIKDLISGFFIILEDQFNLGDEVKIGTFEGRVERITLRLTVLRDKGGNLIYIPNSQINSVIRYSS
ncbi:MAG: mechanosensitive ion channel [bacterium]|nr:mechanosensitive ion channel [bacterium]